MDPNVEKYLEKQNHLKKSICLELRNIIFEIFPDIKEEYRWGAIVYDNGRYYIGVVRRGVNLGFSINGLSQAEKQFFKGTGKTMRHLKFESLSDINEDQIKNLLYLVRKKALVQY